MKQLVLETVQYDNKGFEEKTLNHNNGKIRKVDQEELKGHYIKN